MRDPATSGPAGVNPLRQLRAAVKRAEALADGDSNDAEIEAWQVVGDLFADLDEWLSRGGFPPEAWREGPDA